MKRMDKYSFKPKSLTNLNGRTINEWRSSPTEKQRETIRATSPDLKQFLEQIKGKRFETKPSAWHMHFFHKCYFQWLEFLIRRKWKVLRGIVSRIVLALILISMITATLEVQPTIASGIVYIKADASINPVTAPIITVDNITFTLTDNINTSIVVERNNIILDGAGHTIQGIGNVGIDVTYRKNITICNFKVVGFSIGIKLNSSDNIHIMFNVITNNKYGIRVVNSTNCDFRFNNIRNNHPVGIFLNSRPSATRNFTLIGNDISNNSVGVWLWDSSGNIIYHNNFSNNTIQVSLHNSQNNNWDDGFEGNYWSDYRGGDIDKDAIGDKPYTVDENNQDSHPLMAKFQHFTVQIGNRLYKIGAICTSTIVGEGNKLSFILGNVSGATLCRLCIPHALIEPPYSIVIGPPYTVDNPLCYRTVQTNGTHTWIYFTYPYSEEATITIVRAIKLPPFWFQWWFWVVCILLVATAAFFGEYLLQRKIIEAYKRQLESFQQISHIDRTKILFEADVRRCQRKLEEFAKKHHVLIRHREETLEDALKRMGIKEKNKK